LEQCVAQSPEKREAQSALADAVTTLVHGEAGTADAKRCAEVLFGGGSLAGLNERQLEDIFGGVPSTSLPRERLAAMTLADLFAETKLASSKGEARRLITGGGAYVNNERASDPQLALSSHPALSRAMLVLRSGKKNYHLVKLT